MGQHLSFSPVLMISNRRRRRRPASPGR
ncbi:hypothetical protein G443_002650 [Actinoalloteichus cyanogriseus DSM 43889]|uniref:Uncharacterized protein n=1 Tax=Actinoalloteichus caeruleus DSM 43889 TaxID=1120930 RepID=A0ABT1JIN9_ACTCY|nr:hypothetical protein [Actinoalloteichus caeruleus DSM 43889]